MSCTDEVGCDVCECKSITEVPGVSVNSEDEIFHASATSGHSLQLTCDVLTTQSVVWTRLGRSLHDVPQFEASVCVCVCVCVVLSVVYSRDGRE